MNRYWLVLIISILLISCENHIPTSYNELSASGTGIWCVIKHPLGFINTYYLAKYSFDGKLMYWGEPHQTIEDLEIYKNNGDLFYIEGFGKIIKRDQSGIFLAEFSTNNQALITDISINQNDETLWSLKENYSDLYCYIYHLSSSFQYILSDTSINWAYKLTCNQTDNTCITSKDFDEQPYNRFTIIDASGNISIRGAMSWKPYGSDFFEFSKSDETSWTAINLRMSGNFYTFLLSHYSPSGFLIQEKIHNYYKAVDMCIDQESDSLFIVQLLDSHLSVQPTSSLYKYDSNGNIVWMKNLNCTSVCYLDGYLWVGVKPNIIMKLSPDGEIIDQFTTLGEVTDIEVWNG